MTKVDMPHSTREESSSSHKGTDEDSILPDAPPEADVETREEDSDASQEEPTNSKDTAKRDVKLEDLFNDEDSDDTEFPSSGISNGKMESSPPAAPM